MRPCERRLTRFPSNQVYLRCLPLGDRTGGGTNGNRDFDDAGTDYKLYLCQGGIYNVVGLTERFRQPQGAHRARTLWGGDLSGRNDRR